MTEFNFLGEIPLTILHVIQTC